MSAASPNLVAGERRMADRRASGLHVVTAADRRGKKLNTHEQSRLELLLCEAQAAAEHALACDEQAIAAAKTLTEALRQARAASVAARRAAHLAAGAVSGVTS